MAIYKATIGMEIHCELKTNSKMFSVVTNGLGDEGTPNSSIDTVTTAQPGSLPVPNEKAIRYVQMAGLALECEIARVSKFDRKHYFYPDLPKGYQISQYDQPLCGKGFVMVDGENIGITRIHMEEDTGKNTHLDGSTFVDLNRAGVPLMELVSEPDLTTGAQARAFCQKLQQTFRYLGISDADIEKGQMRCEVNLSLYEEGDDPLSGTKVEVKNIGSFRSVERAANYEIARQTEILEEGGTIMQETRGWDDDAGKTVSQRSKENANDYRYFPEPDIPPMTFSDDYIDNLKRALPELPDAKAARFEQEYGIRAENAQVILSDQLMATYFEQTASELADKKASGEMSGDTTKAINLAANYLVSEVQKHLTAAHMTIDKVKMTAENFAEVISMTIDGTINSSATQALIEEMVFKGGDPSHIAEKKDLIQENDTGALEAIVDEVLAANEASVADYKAGKENAIKYLMGQTMKLSGGKANPQAVMELLKEKLS